MAHIRRVARRSFYLGGADRNPERIRERGNVGARDRTGGGARGRSAADLLLRAEHLQGENGVCVLSCASSLFFIQVHMTDDDVSKKDDDDPSRIG